jgi:hypothetical protein
MIEVARGYIQDDPSRTNILAGRDFSLGLVEDGTSTVTGPDFAIVGKGKDDYHQVSDVTKLPPGRYITIEAGTTRSAVLDHDGTIRRGGQAWSGSELQTGNRYTDIVLGPDYGFALRETAAERQITGPISPGHEGVSRAGTGEIIPIGSTLYHTHNDVTRIFAPNGKELFWVNDADSASQVRFPSGATLPTSLIHYVQSGSTVDARTDYRATVGNPTLSGGNELTVNEEAWYDESGPDVKPTLPRAMCFADIGCSAGTAAKQNLFLSDPIESVAPAATAGGYTPVFSVRQIDNGTWVGTLGVLGSTNPADTVTITQKKRPADPSQPIRFTLVSGNWSREPGMNMWIDAKADLTSENAGLHYTVTGTTSKAIPGMTITPQIWEKSDTGDVLVYTGDTVVCSAGMMCVAAGNFAPSDTATYYANATVLYTVPVTTANGVTAGTQRYEILSASAGVTASANQATNIEGTRDDYPTFDYYKDVVQYAKTKQNGKGYNAVAYLKPTTATLNSRFPNDYIIFYNGHSEAGRLEIDDTSGSEQWYCAQGCPGSQFDDISLTYARFVQFMSCNSGNSDDTHGNLVNKAYEKGADCVFGYTATLSGFHAPLYYSQSFWDAAKNGESWNNAHQTALTSLKNQQTTCNNDDACGYGDRYYQGGSACNFVMTPHRSENANPFPESSLKNLVQEKAIILNFTEISDPDLSYMETVHGDSGDSYKFGSDIGQFYVNAQTGRVQNAVFFASQTNSTKEIDLDQAYLIALNYAQKKYPSLWETTGQRGVKTVAAKRMDHGDDYDYTFYWRDEYSVTDNKSGKQYAITGPNLALITLAATGTVQSYDERVVSVDPSLNLIPDISESQAWTIAADTFASHGILNVEKSPAKDLAIFPEEDTGKQHLTWYFATTNNNGRGGEIWIDAHNGSVVEYIPYM